MGLEKAVPSFVIMLREALEATLVVGIVLVTLRQSGQLALRRWVWLGVAGAVAASVLIGAVSQAALGGFSGTPYHLSKGIFSLIAVGMLSWMLVWMTAQAKTLKQQVVDQVSKATEMERGAGWALFLLVAVAIMREGAEIVLFLAGTFKLDPNVSGVAKYAPFIGCFAGVAAAVGIGLGLFQFGVRLNLQAFFKGLGVFLLLIVGGLLVNALSALDAANTITAIIDPQTGRYKLLAEPAYYVPFYTLGPLILDFSPYLPSDSVTGKILNALIGYTDRVHLVQLVAWLGYLGVAGNIYFRALGGNLGKKAAGKTASAAV